MLQQYSVGVHSVVNVKMLNSVNVSGIKILLTKVFVHVLYIIFAETTVTVCWS